MEGTVICASRADALVTRPPGIADNAGEDTGVGGTGATGATGLGALPATVDFDGDGLAGFTALAALDEAGFAATLADVLVVDFATGFFVGTDFLGAALAVVFGLAFAAGFFTPALDAVALAVLAAGLGLTADFAVGFTDAAFLGAALAVLDATGLAWADLTLDGRDDTDLADLAFT